MQMAKTWQEEKIHEYPSGWGSTGKTLYRHKTDEELVKTYESMKFDRDHVFWNEKDMWNNLQTQIRLAVIELNRRENLKK